MKTFSKWFITTLLKIYFWLTLRLDASDIQKIPMQGPFIVISNHTGQIEVPVMVTLLQPRKISGWGKAEAFENLFLRWVFWAWGIIPIHRGEADMKALKDALRALQDGCFFGIAPEGTRNKTGVLIRAHPGTALLALRSGAPILPLAHWGGEAFLKNLRGFKSTDFHLRVGEPFKLKVEGKVSAEMRQEIVDDMMYEIAKLIPEEYRGVYSDLSKATGKYLVREK